jgi:hypothetical protein
VSDSSLKAAAALKMMVKRIPAGACRKEREEGEGGDRERESQSV